jgi:hypothetical protein
VTYTVAWNEEMQGRAIMKMGSVQIFLIPFYLQAVQIHSANGVKLLEASRGLRPLSFCSGDFM